ncbi:MAG: acyl carrier protein [Chitinophagales bacterium]|nr:acyl carrier protein [Bacteroidota bacterium]MBK8682337.1 acyl carrier protein [Bacteroidota bacterium]
MERDEIRIAITGVFSKVFKDPNLVLKDEYSATDLDKWDSINNMIIMTRIEKLLNINIETAELIELKSVGDLLTLIENKLS